MFRRNLFLFLIIPALALADSSALTGPPGNYTITAPDPVVITHPTPTSIQLDWGGGIPPGPIPPPPPPIPPPGPTPATGILHVTAVFDTDSMTPDAAKVRSSVTIGPALKGLNAVWRAYESQSPDLDRLNLRPTVTATGPPCLIVQDKDGKLVRAVKIVNESDIISLVKGLR